MPLKHDWASLTPREIEQISRTRLANEVLERIPEMADAPYEAQVASLITEMSAGSFGGQGFTQDLIDALAGTDGTPNAANPFVTSSDPRLGGGTGLLGWTSAKSTGGLAGDGITSDASALDTLVNTTLQPSGGGVFLEPGTYLIDEPIVIPSDVTIWFAENAVIRVDGVILRFLGGLSCGISQIFECVNGGKVEFFTNQSWQSVKARVDDVYTEWFGAKGDGTTIDSDAFDRAWESIRGYPQTPLSTPSWGRGVIRLRAGGKYRLNRPFLLGEASIGPALFGGGAENTQIIYDRSGANTKYTASSYPSSNQITLQSVPAGDLVGMWLVPCGPTHIGQSGLGSGNEENVGNSQPREITAQNGNTLTTNGDHNWSDTSNQFYILDRAIIDISGVFDATVKDLSIGGPSPVMSGIYYHRDARRTARGSSRGHFRNIVLNVKSVQAAMAIGSFTPGQTLHQEDLATCWGVRVFGAWKEQSTDDQKIFYQNAWRFGSNSFSNPLNYTCHGCVAHGHRRGILVAATNLTWHGGTVQSNETDIALNNGLQSYVDVSGFRSEGSRCLVAGTTTQTVGFTVNISDIEFRGESVTKKADTGTYDIVRLPFPGMARVERIRVISMPNGGNLPYTGIGTDVDGNGYVDVATANWQTDEWKGECVEIVDPNAGTSFWRGMTYEVLSNTQTRIKIKGTWERGSFGGSGIPLQDFAPDGARFVRPVRVPRFRYTGVQAPSIWWQDIVAGPNMGHHQLFPTDGNSASRETWIVNCPPMRSGADPAFPAQWGRQGTVHFGRETIGLKDYGTVPSGQEGVFAQLTGFTWSRVQLTKNLDVHLGGEVIAGQADADHPYAPLPYDGQVFYLITEMDATGGRQINWLTSLSLVWQEGVAPPPQSPNLLRIYRFQRKGTKLYAQVFFDEESAYANKLTVNDVATFKGQVKAKVTEKVVSTNYTITLDDEAVGVDASGGNRVISLPPLASAVGHVVEIRKIDSSPNTVTIDADGTELIHDVQTLVLSAPFDAVVLRARSGQWVY